MQIFAGKKRFKNFCIESFRARTKKDYAEFFSRGFVGKKKKNTAYPWLYLRFLALSLIIFAAYCILGLWTGNGVVLPAVVAIGALFANFTVLTLAFELYRRRDFSFVSVVLIAVLGAILSDIIILSGYKLLQPTNSWLSTLWTAVLEEAGKFIPALVIYLLVGKRNPALAFLIGAAVGTGMAVTEDMGYILWDADGFSPDYAEAIGTALTRGASAICTHAPWTAIPLYAFAKFKRPLINFKFYLLLLLSIALHFVWDMPIEVEYAVFTIAACAVIVLAVCVKIYKCENKAEREEGRLTPELTDESPAAEAKIPYVKPFGISHIADLVATFCCMVICACMLAYCCVEPGWRFTEKVFTDPQEFIEFIQCGLHPKPDKARAYDKIVPNSDALYRENKLIWATQKVADGEFTYYYRYYFIYEEEKGESAEAKNKSGELKYDPEATRITVKHKDNTAELEYIYTSEEANEESKIEFYRFNTKCGAVYFENGIITVDTTDLFYKGGSESIIIGAVVGAAFIGGLTAYTVLKLKAKKEAKVEEVKSE